MPLTGYQDWQRVNYAAGLIVLSVFQGVANTFSQNLPDLSAWPYLNISFFAPAGASNYSVQLLWYNDSAFTTQVATTSVTFNSNMNGLYCVPTLTPFLKVQIVPNPTGNNTVISCFMYGADQYTEPWGFDTFSTPWVLGSSALLANGTRQDFTFTNYSGRVFLSSFASAAGAWQLDVAYFDFGAQAYKTFAHFAIAASGTLMQEMGVPFAQLRITVTNGAVAQTVTEAMVAVP